MARSQPGLLGCGSCTTQAHIMVPLVLLYTWYEATLLEVYVLRTPLYQIPDYSRVLPVYPILVSVTCSTQYSPSICPPSTDEYLVPGYEASGYPPFYPGNPGDGNLSSRVSRPLLVAPYVQCSYCCTLTPLF